MVQTRHFIPHFCYFLHTFIFDTFTQIENSCERNPSHMVVWYSHLEQYI